MAETSEPSAHEVLLVAHLPDIERIVASIARRHALDHDVADDLKSEVLERLVQNDYRALRRYRGKGSIRAFLSVVAANVWKDQNIRRFGRWRPSAKAKSMGAEAVTLETWIYRDGQTIEESVSRLLESDRCDLNRTQLMRLVASLPIRSRRRFVTAESISLSNSTQVPDADLSGEDLQSRADRVAGEISAVISTWTSEDRLILRMRFFDGMKVSEIARAVRLPQKPLYRRIERMLGKLRTALEEEGVEPQDVMDLVGQGEVEWR
ncbi:MAG: sigma-70 family RNA polymerase sigma factor [Gemmatimonadetes bacterium]|nr:sigma-70 family RNA polymerase sigma factor [Gemmatimonadota bacterium]